MKKISKFEQINRDCKDCKCFIQDEDGVMWCERCHKKISMDPFSGKYIKPAPLCSIRG